MNARDIEVKNTPESIREAYKAFRGLGYDPLRARKSVFLALGGDDVVWELEDGTEVYARSGVRVDSIRWPPEWNQ